MLRSPPEAAHRPFPDFAATRLFDANERLAGEQLRGDALCFHMTVALDQELFEADTEQRPVGLRDGEVAPEIEQGTRAPTRSEWTSRKVK